MSDSYILDDLPHEVEVMITEYRTSAAFTVDVGLVRKYLTEGI
jgi:hypothetical protein